MNKKRILPETAWSSPHAWKPTVLSLAVLTASLIAVGIGEGMLVLAALGSSPWTVFAQGVAAQTGMDLGWAVLILSTVVLLSWLPLRQRPGIGTVLNMLLIAASVGLFVRLMPAPQEWLGRILFCIGGVTVFGIASAFYLTCYLGAGPRDGLMVGLCSRYGWPVGRVRMAMETSVCFIGWLMGGTAGIGTLLFAFGVGWVVQWTLEYMRRKAGKQAV